jgi:hydrogenase maturation protein HypF
MIEARVKITGRVQGVGFRPFIYRKAMKYGLKGYVRNLGDAGVELVVEGSRENFSKFMEEIKKDSPQVSEIKDVSVKYGFYSARFDSFIMTRAVTPEGLPMGSSRYRYLSRLHKRYREPRQPVVQIPIHSMCMVLPTFHSCEVSSL